MLDRRKVGLGLTVFLELKLRINSEQQAAELERKVADIDEIVACHMLAGAADFLLEIVVPDLAAYEQLLFHTLLELADVTDVRSNIAIRTAKEHGPLPLARP
jgi:Lrp/AsnC family leucine-responsive transcriptional regulator